MAGKYTAKRCSEYTPKGRCRAYAVKGSKKCIFHSNKAGPKALDRSISYQKRRMKAGGGRRFRK